MTSESTTKDSGVRWVRRGRLAGVGAAATGLALVMGCVAAAPALASPTEPRQVHVVGLLLPVDESPGVHRVAGGLVGTYTVRNERAIQAWTHWTTQIREIEGTGSFDGCVDQNQNQSCDAGEPSGEFGLSFTRVASFDTGTGRLIESRTTHHFTGRDQFSAGTLTTRDIPVGNSNGILSTYEGDLQLVNAPVDRRRAQ